MTLLDNRWGGSCGSSNIADAHFCICMVHADACKLEVLASQIEFTNAMAKKQCASGDEEPGSTSCAHSDRCFSCFAFVCPHVCVCVCVRCNSSKGRRDVTLPVFFVSPTLSLSLSRSLFFGVPVTLEYVASWASQKRAAASCCRGAPAVTLAAVASVCEPTRRVPKAGA